jgi:shikimate dehydrogenase
VILGAGGAARAIIVALQDIGFRRVVLANRTAARAGALAAEFAIEPVAWERVAADTFPSAALVVNATSLGWHDELPLAADALARIAPGALVADLTYRDTAFLRAASRLGHPVMDGLGMLVHQGARAFELWTGIDAPVDVMREAVLAEQARRAGE